MRRYFYLLGFSTLLFASPTWSAQKAGNLYAACISAPGTEADALCAAYINGYTNGVLGDQVATENGSPICLPDNTPTGQIRALFTDFVRTRPKALEIDTGGLLAELMAEAYPCRKPN